MENEDYEDCSGDYDYEGLYGYAPDIWADPAESLATYAEYFGNL